MLLRGFGGAEKILAADYREDATAALRPLYEVVTPVHPNHPGIRKWTSGGIRDYGQDSAGACPRERPQPPGLRTLMRYHRRHEEAIWADVDCYSVQWPRS